MKNQIITQQVIGKEVGSKLAISKEEEQKSHLDANQVAFSLCSCDDLLGGVDRHAPDRRKKLPLVGVRLEVGIDEHAGARFARRELQRETGAIAPS